MAQCEGGEVLSCRDIRGFDSRDQVAFALSLLRYLTCVPVALCLHFSIGVLQLPLQRRDALICCSCLCIDCRAQALYFVRAFDIGSQFERQLVARSCQRGELAAQIFFESGSFLCGLFACGDDPLRQCALALDRSRLCIGCRAQALHFVRAFDVGSQFDRQFVTRSC